MSELEELKEDIADLENVSDADEDVVATSNLFSISSFGVDYPVETLVSRMTKSMFYIPDFRELLFGLKINLRGLSSRFFLGCLCRVYFYSRNLIREGTL